MDDANELYEIDTDTAFRRICDEAVSTIMQDVKPDTDLLNILMDHIVVPDPDADVVKRAAAEIQKLAERRAES